MSPFLSRIPTMFRGMNKRKKGRRGYQQLISDSNGDDLLPEPKMERSLSLPPSFSGDFPVVLEKNNIKVDFTVKQMRKVSKVHPIFSLFEKKSRKKKATAKPEFSRYLQYLREGGIWDANSAKPVIYY